MMSLNRKIFLNKIFISISILFFFASRFIIIYMYRILYSDVEMFYNLAKLGILEGYTAYKDFFFPYPPLALPFVYLPINFATSFRDYRLVFQYEMFIFDVICLLFMILFVKKKLKFNETKIASVILLYSLLGMLVGRLLYDRLDIVLITIIMAMIYFYSESKRSKIIYYLLALMGSLVKLVPIFLIPISMVIDFWDYSKNTSNTDCSLWSEFKRRSESLFIPLLVFFIPFVSILMIYNIKVGGSLFMYLLQHGERGIQIQSTWATPLFIRYLLSSSKALEIVTNYGAQHIHESFVSGLYVFISKYFGFSFLSLFYIFYFFYYRRLKQKNPQYKIQADFYFLTLFAILIFLLISQRVLSPQFFIWVIPGFCIFIILSSKRIFYLFLTFTIYALTFLEFDNYWMLVYLKTPGIMVNIFRNLFLIIASFLVFYTFKKKVSELLSRGNE